MAENHPVGFHWVIEARERGAHVIHVDPRFSRTSAMPTIWAPLRAGLATSLFLGGLINYVLDAANEFPRIRRAYTNASILISATTSRDPRISAVCSPAGIRERQVRPRRPGSTSCDARRTRPRRDPTLEHPRCVFQVLKRHFARYTPEMVERVCGVPQERFLEIAETYTSRVRTGEDRRDLLCGRMDAAFDRRADHPLGGDPAAAARQHRTARRRHHGAARPRLDPGLDRHPDALRHPSRLSADAEVRAEIATLAAYIDAVSRRERAGGRTSTSTSSAC